MKVRATLILAAMIGPGITAHAGQRKPAIVTVYVQDNANAPQQAKIQAENLASDIFASIGVRIDWRNADPPASPGDEEITIDLAITPKGDHSGRLAYALSREGIHIVVYWDRIEYRLVTTELLAHVMAHEITHILEGVNRHSKTGVMKAIFTDYDLKTMRTHPLIFSAEDVDLIQRGLATRHAPEWER